MTYESIIKELKAKKYHSIYYLCGEEAYYIDQVVNHIEENVLNESERSFNQTVLYGKDIADTPQLMDEVYRLPMMSAMQVVILKEAQAFKKLDEFLEKYLQKPVKSTLLVIAVKDKKLDKRKKVTKILTENAVVLETIRMKEKDMPVWIQQYLSSEGYSAGPDALQTFCDYLGTEISVITNELSKLMLNKPKGSTITSEDIEKYIGISKDYNNFELQKALALKDNMKAFRIVNYFNSNQKENPLVVTISTLHTFFSTLFQFHYIKNLSEKELQSQFGLWPEKLKEYRAASVNYNLRKTEDIIRLIAEYDLRSKGVSNTNVESASLLQELICRIIYN